MDRRIKAEATNRSTSEEVFFFQALKVAHEQLSHPQVGTKDTSHARVRKEQLETKQKGLATRPIYPSRDRPARTCVRRTERTCRRQLAV
jgi:hypothetical protein